MDMNNAALGNIGGSDDCGALASVYADLFQHRPNNTLDHMDWASDDLRLAEEHTETSGQYFATIIVAVLIAAVAMFVVFGG